MGIRYGQFIHSPGFLQRRSFAGGRSLTILVADAMVAGITGYECNGLAIIDEDNQAIILDQHLLQGSGWSGPSREQVAEFRRVTAMDWDALTAFCRSNPQFRRGVAADIDVASPPRQISEIDRLVTAGTLGTPGPDIRTPEMIAADADPAVEIGFPLKTREDMIVFLSRHSGYGRHGFAVSWDIKVRRFDFSGHSGDEKVDPQFDEKWLAYVDVADGLFWSACEDALAPYLEGDYTTWPGDDEGSYKFHTDGHSNGHLCLQSWTDGPQPGAGQSPMRFESRDHYIRWLKALEPADLVRFYKLVASVDHDTSQPAKEIAYHYNLVRAAKEQEWLAELEPAGVAAP